VREHRAAATTAGILYIIGTAAGIASKTITAFPVHDADDPLGYAAKHSGTVASGALLVPLADTMSAGPGTASPAGVRLGTLVIDSDGASVIMSLVFCLGAALFYVLLYRSRIVPRWITWWGFVGIPLYVAAYLLAMYGVVDINSSEVNLLSLPLAVQEMVLAVWMIARGFRPAAVSNTPEF
jgi:uncharacterized membrane protein (Fun14 family)